MTLTEALEQLRKAQEPSEIVLSDITLMERGYCVIGLMRLPDGSIQSVRPFPPGRPERHAWSSNELPFQRGERVLCRLTAAPISRPHFEDCQSQGLRSAGSSLNEDELTLLLKRAEVSLDLHGLFRCALRRHWGFKLWADPDEATRSICGCQYTNIRFQVRQDGAELKLFADLVLPSNERADRVKVVDREWHEFLGKIIRRIEAVELDVALARRAEQFLNDSVRPRLTESPNRFARIGLPRASPQFNRQCYLMVSSLFPQPQRVWLSVL